MKKKIVANLLFLFLGVILCCAVLEAGIRLLYPRFANYNLEMWRYIATLKEPTGDPSLPFVHAPNGEGVFYGIPVETNRIGLRGPEVACPKPEGLKRILMLGDSLVFGWGVPQEKTIAMLLQEKLSGSGSAYEVVNMGVGNYNTTMETELFKRVGLALQPDAVILVFFVNDPEPIPKLNSLTYSFKQHSYLFAVVFDTYQRMRARWDEGFNWLDYYSGLYRPESPALEQNRKSLVELAQICREKGIALFFVNYPELHQLKEYPLTVATDYVRTMANETGTPFMDLLPAFAGHSPESLWVSAEDAHGNAKAAALAAEAIHRHFGEMLAEAGLAYIK